MNDLNVTDRIDIALHVHNIRFIEDANHMKYAIACFDMRQKRITETLTFTGTFDQTSNVNNLSSEERNKDISHERSSTSCVRLHSERPVVC